MLQGVLSLAGLAAIGIVEWVGINEAKNIAGRKYMELYNAENKTNYTIETFHSDETLYEKYNAFEHAYTCAYLQYNMTPGNKIGIIADPLALLKELTTYHLEGLAKAYKGPNKWKHNADLNRDLWNNKQGVMEAYNAKKCGKSFEYVVTSIYKDIAHSNPDDFNEKYITKLHQNDTRKADNPLDHFSNNNFIYLSRDVDMTEGMINDLYDKYNGYRGKFKNADSETVSDKLKNKTFVITGTLSKPRNDFEAIIKSMGGKVSSSVSKKTDYVLCGENPGSKFDKATSLGVIILNEVEFKNLIEE